MSTASADMSTVSAEDLDGRLASMGYETRPDGQGRVEYRPPGAIAWWSTAPAWRYHRVGDDIVLRPDRGADERELPRLLADDWGRWHWLEDEQKWWWAQWEVV